MLIQGGFIRHCIYGADADLIMLGLSTHEPHFYVIREKLIPTNRFNKNNQKGKTNSNSGVFVPDEDIRTSNFQIPFTFVKIFMVRFFLDGFMKNVVLPFRYCLENIIDDFVLLCFLVGNDFLPHIPGFNIRVGGIDILLNFYRRILGGLDGYLTNNCDVNLANLEKFFVNLSKCEFNLLRKLEMTQSQWVG